MLKHRYDLTLEQYEELFHQQRGVCAICGKSKQYLLHVDHCHTTNKVRGLLCSPCNVFLGILKDNTEGFDRAIKYLEKAHQG